MGRGRTWTDEQLRVAVADSHNVKMVCTKLGLCGTGIGYYEVKWRIRELGFDTTHFGQPRRSYPWTTDALRVAYVEARNWRHILERLEVDPSRKHRRALTRHLDELGLAPIDPGRTLQRRRWTDDDLRAAVASARGLATTIKSLGLIPAGGNYETVRRQIVELGLDTSHFRGQGWSRDEALGPRPRLPLDQVLVANRWTTTSHLKERLIREGYKKAECEMCSWAQRSADGRLPLELDHINGDRTDNRLENLRVLCPNCHSLQPTHRGSNKRRRSVVKR